MRTLILKPVSRKKNVSISFFTTNNNTVVISNLAPPAWNSITRFDANYVMFCQFGDTLSLMMFSSFSSAVLLLHNETRSICATPIPFFERGDLERTRHLLATWQDSRWRRKFARSFLFQVFPHLCEEATRYVSRSNFFKVLRKILHGNHFIIKILMKTQQIFNHDREHMWDSKWMSQWLIQSYCLMSLMDMDWSDV